MLKTQPLGSSGNKISNWQFKVSNWTFLLKLNNVDNFWIRSCEEGPSWLEELSKIVAEELILSLCVLKKDETKTLLFTWQRVFLPAQQCFQFESSLFKVPQYFWQMSTIQTACIGCCGSHFKLNDFPVNKEGKTKFTCYLLIPCH